MSARGRKKRHHAKKGFLSEFFKPAEFKTAAKGSLNGFIGGGGAAVLDHLLPADTNEFMRFIAHAGASVLVGGGLGYHKIGAGWAGGYAYSVTDRLITKGMSEMENTNYADDDSMSEYPDALDEGGNPLFLAEDGNFYYMEDYELADDGETLVLSDNASPYALSESFQDYNMYPRYSQSSQY